MKMKIEMKTVDGTANFIIKVLLLNTPKTSTNDNITKRANDIFAMPDLIAPITIDFSLKLLGMERNIIACDMKIKVNTNVNINVTTKDIQPPYDIINSNDSM